MPRNVRNFWITAEIDGRDSKVVGGPVAKDGGFSLTIRQRDNGGIVIAAEINGRVESDGTLRLYVVPGLATMPHGDGIVIETRR